MFPLNIFINDESFRQFQSIRYNYTQHCILDRDPTMLLNKGKHQSLVTFCHRFVLTLLLLLLLLLLFFFFFSFPSQNFFFFFVLKEENTRQNSVRTLELSI